MDLGKFGEAYEFARSRSGEEPEWHYLHALAAHMTGRFGEAVPIYDRAQQAEPGFGIRLLFESNRHEFTVTRRDLRLPSQACSCTKL